MLLPRIAQENTGSTSKEEGGGWLGSPLEVSRKVVVVVMVAVGGAGDGVLDRSEEAHV